MNPKGVSTGNGSVSFSGVCMRWTRFFLILFLVPGLICASSYDANDHQKDLDKTTAEWKRHDELVRQFNGLGFNEREHNLGLLNESIACCQRAIGHCDHILEKISKKSEKKSWEEAKNQAKQNKNTLNKEIGDLQALINHTLAFAKAVPLHHESEKKANLANLQGQNCARRLNNIEEVVSALNQAGNLYEEALSLAQGALNLIFPYPDEVSKNVLRQAIENYRAAANKYKKEAAEWPAAVEAQKAALKERLVILKEDRRLFEEKGLKRSSYEVQKQTVAILEQLIESSSIEEGEPFKEELAEIKKANLAFETEADSHRLTVGAPSLPFNDFKNREIERREHFFKNPILQDPTYSFKTFYNPVPVLFPWMVLSVKKTITSLFILTNFIAF